MRWGGVVRNIRLLSGLVLMAFVASHLANLAIGIHSLDALEAWRAALTGAWTRGAGPWLLAGAATVHVALGLYAIASRRSLALSRVDVVQLVLGLLTPPLLLNHVVATASAIRVAPDFDASYGQILAVYWSFAPAYAFQQLLVVVGVWMHGALGLYSWLVLQPIWRRIGGVVLPLLFAVPILALLGFAEAGKEVLDRLANDAAWRTHVIDNVGRIAAVTRELAGFQSRALAGYAALVLLAAGVFGLRLLRDRRRPVQVAYDGGFSAQGRRGLSILELSLLNDVPHAHVCSGRARCGTCRVRIDQGANALTPIAESERRTLERTAALAGERLACQARVLGDGVAVTRVLPPYADASAARSPEEWRSESPAQEPST
jgi:adenylate cyclase